MKSAWWWHRKKKIEQADIDRGIAGERVYMMGEKGKARNPMSSP